MQSSVCASRRADVTRLFVAEATISMVLLDLAGRCVEVSPAFLELTGMRREQFLGQIITHVVPDAAEGVEATRHALARGIAKYEYERTARLPSGRTLRTRTQGAYWRDDDGVPIGILFINQDMTAEYEAAQARDKSEALLRAVVDNLPAGLSVIDLESGQVALTNVAVLQALGLASEDGLRGRRLSELVGRAGSEDVERFAAAAEAAGGSIEIEREIDGGAWAGRAVRMKNITFADARGRRQLLCIAEDVTALRSAAKALERAAAEAEAANRAKSEFLANMSHEIRTPLNGVMGVAGALARTPLSSPQREMVSIIETSAQTLEALLSDILDLARIEAGRMELSPEPFDLATSVNACGALFDAAAQAKGLDLHVEIAPEALGAYVGDAARIRQILSNLLSNAVKFTERGGIRLAVSARRKETSSELRFEVSDSGIGFDGEALARLFSRFEQADGSITRRFGGSGLGLAISRSLAEVMGGRLEADGAPGEGAVFTFTLELPRGVGGMEFWGEAAEPAHAIDPVAGLRVLLAEDHPTNRRVVQLILGAAGVDLTCVENGAEAVEAFGMQAFDLILMDMQMPVMDGLTAIDQIRSMESLAGAPPTPIYVLTANAMPEHVSASLAAGADGHLFKPILAEALLERVEEVARAALTAGSRQGAVQAA